jgi:hypothetical protein
LTLLYTSPRFCSRNKQQHNKAWWGILISLITAWDSGLRWQIVLVSSKLPRGKLGLLQPTTVLYCTVRYRTVPYRTIPYRTVPYHTVPYHTVLYCAVLCCAVLCCTVLYCTVLYCTVLYCTIHWANQTTRNLRCIDTSTGGKQAWPKKAPDLQQFKQCQAHRTAPLSRRALLKATGSQIEGAQTAAPHRLQARECSSSLLAFSQPSTFPPPPQKTCLCVSPPHAPLPPCP